MEETIGPTRTGRWAPARVVTVRAMAKDKRIARMANCYTRTEVGAVTAVTGLPGRRLLHQ